MASTTQPPVTVRRRLLLLKGLMGLGFLSLAGQLWYLQLARGDEYRRKAETNRLRVRSVKPLRGVIYDRAGRQLVRNIPSFSIAVLPADLPRAETPAVAQRLAGLLEVDAGEIEATIQEARADPYQPVIIKSNVPRETALIIEEQHHRLPGVHVQFSPVRQYVAGDVLGPLLGYTGPLPRELFKQLSEQGYERDDRIGLTGLEATYEDELRGVKGREYIEVDVYGRAVRSLHREPPVAGHNLVLTIDLEFQRAVDAFLRETLAQARSRLGVAIVLDVRTGAVLAMASRPAYDNNLFATGISPEDYRALAEDPMRPMVNHAIGGQHSPGSVFKVVTAAAALQEAIVTPRQSIQCTGQLTLPGGWIYVDWLKTGHGATNLLRAIAQSCDIYFYSVAGGNPHINMNGLGNRRLVHYAQAFGFGSRTGIRLPGEAAGFLPTEEWKRTVKKEPWYQGDTFNVGIGQGDVLVTPLQVAVAYVAIANNGQVLEPQLVYEVRDPEGNVVRRLEPVVRSRLPVAPEYLAAIRAGLREAVTSGTARGYVRTTEVPIAGKTGTAEFGVKDARGQYQTHAWFAAYAPEAEPQIAVVTFIYGGGEGSSVAAPLADRIIRAYFKLPDLPQPTPTPLRPR
jgi:penicillin-binding protein 2